MFGRSKIENGSFTLARIDEVNEVEGWSNIFNGTNAKLKILEKYAFWSSLLHMNKRIIIIDANI